METIKSLKENATNAKPSYADGAKAIWLVPTNSRFIFGEHTTYEYSVRFTAAGCDNSFVSNVTVFLTPKEITYFTNKGYIN